MAHGEVKTDLSYTNYTNSTHLALAHTEQHEPRICEHGGKGLFLPLLESEQDWDRWLRVALYLFCMLYIFYGVGMATDKFMESIMTITSLKRRVKLKNSDRVVTFTVWNRTIANLSLMAVGTSAPELLLSVIECVAGGFYSGELGPSTITGSGAFNQLGVIAVCTAVIPAGEIRFINDLNVFWVTAIFSIMGYVWVVFVLTVTTPDCMDIAEGCITLVMFVALLVVSYLTDIGYIQLCGKREVTKGKEADVEKALSAADPSTAAGAALAIQLREQLRILEEQQARLSSVIGRPEQSFLDTEVLNSKGFAIECQNGVLTFNNDTLIVHAGLQEKRIVVPVQRKNGARGEVRCGYHTEHLTAVAGYDYEDCRGECVFPQGVTRFEIPLKILGKSLGEHHDSFQVVLSGAKGGAIFNPNCDGGPDRQILTVTILNESDALATRSPMLRISRCLDGLCNLDLYRASAHTWRHNLHEAIFDTGSEDGTPASPKQLFMHFFGLPWKLLLAILIPPEELAGGWFAFVMALGIIGFVTALLIDFAELFACLTNIDDSILAITLVAVGTSLPDMFASMVAAVQDEHADAAIVNVTGSNSANIFIGVGIPWTLAAFYWNSVGATEEWKQRYASEYLERYPHGGFIVPTGDLVYSTLVYLLCALLSLVVLHFMRKTVGGELGGPAAAKWISAGLYFLLYVMYLSLSIWKTKTPDATVGAQVIAVVISLVVLENLLLLMYGGFLYWGSKFARLPDEEDEDGTEGAIIEPGLADKKTGLRHAAKVVDSDSEFMEPSSGISFRVLGLICLASARLRRKARLPLRDRRRRPIEVERDSLLRPTFASPHPAGYGDQRARLRLQGQGAELPRVPSFKSVEGT